MKIIIASLLIFTIISCSNNEIAPIETNPGTSQYHGKYDFSITVLHTITSPNINNYQVPSSFQTTVTPSADYDDEINLSNIHGLGRCVYAIVNGNSFTIPPQELEGTSEKDIGFNITGNCGSCTLWVAGSGTLTEKARANSADEKFTMTLKYRISFDTTPLARIPSTSSLKEVVSNLPASYSCD